MVNQLQQTPSNSWTTRREEKHRRIQSVQPWMQGPILSPEKIVDALELLIKSRDRIVLEGDNQKQADFLSRSLVKVDPKKLQDLHLIISSISRPEHLTLFELGIAKKVDFSFAGPQSLRLAQLLHLLTFVALIAFGFVAKLGALYYWSLPLIAAGLVFEHKTEKRDLAEINRAFFQSNAFVSAVFLAAVCADRLMR